MNWRTLETIGWVLTALLPLIVLALIHFNAPVIITNVLIGLTFLVGLPLLFLRAKREWRGER
jgi:hypothetical protein